MSTQETGITLIALIITIVVMLILIAVSVDFAIDGKIFDRAEKAVNETNKKVAQQQSRVDYLMGKLDNVLEGGESGSEEPGGEEDDPGGSQGEDEPTVHFHTWSEWETTAQPNCTEEGSKKRKSVHGIKHIII